MNRSKSLFSPEKDLEGELALDSIVNILKFGLSSFVY